MMKSLERMLRVSVPLVALLMPLSEALAEEPPQRLMERMEPISDPVAPAPAPVVRFGFDFGAGWGWSKAPINPVLLAYGAAVDWHATPPFTFGFRLGYVGAAGNTADANGDGARETQESNLQLLDPGLRFRWRIGKGSVRGELEAVGEYRLSLTHAVDHHAAIGAGALLYLKQFGFGARYARALAADALSDSVVVFVERATPIDGDEEPDFPPRDHPRFPRIGLGLHALGTGWGFARGLGIMMPSPAIELPFYFGGDLVPLVRWDFMWFPGIDGPALTAQSALAGLQMYRVAQSRVGLSALGGYTITYGDAPRAAEAGPVADAGFWYWLDTLGFHLGLHARYGLVEANRELRVVYLSIGGRQIF